MRSCLSHILQQSRRARILGLAVLLMCWQFSQLNSGPKATTMNSRHMICAADPQYEANGKMYPPLPRALAEVLRATLSLVDYYGGPVEGCVTLPELKRTLQASITELEVSIGPRNAEPARRGQSEH